MAKQADTDIIDKLSSAHRSDRQEAMLYLYQQMYDKVQAFIQKNSGSVEEARDVFQDSLIALYKQALAGKLGDHIRLEAYFFTICKNLWLKELRKKKRVVELNIHHEKLSEEESYESVMISDEHAALVEQLIQQVGQQCYQLLRHFYYEKRRMKEIAQLLGLSNEQAAKDKKSKCMKKLRGLIKENPHLIKLLK